MNKRSFLRGTAALALAASGVGTLAQEPRPLRILVGFPAGGAPDAVARALADNLRSAAGITAAVENRSGASGKLAIDALLSGPADGTVVTVMPLSVLIMLPLVSESAKFDVTRDFIPVANVAEYGFGVAAGPASGAADLAGYKAWAQANAARSSYATPGLGTPQHFLGVQLERALGVGLNHVPYRGGAQALGDVLGGQVPLLITTEQLLVPHHNQGKLRTLFVTSRERNPKMPAVPTAREVGLGPLEASDWFGLFVRSGTPAARLDELRAATARAMASAGYRDAVSGMGYGIPRSQPANFTPGIDGDRAAWAERIRLSGFKATD